MEAVLTFLKDNAINIFAVLVLILFLYPRVKLVFNKSITNVTSEEAMDLIRSNKDLIILDVRTAGEFNSGHIQGAKNIPIGELTRKIKELEKYRGKPLLVHCASGNRSIRAVGILNKNKFSPIYHMNRGLSSWNGGLKR